MIREALVAASVALYTTLLLPHVPPEEVAAQLAAGLGICCQGKGRSVQEG